MDKMESLLQDWIQDQTRCRLPLSSIWMKLKAKSSDNSGSKTSSTFRASPGWILQFKNFDYLHNLLLPGNDQLPCLPCFSSSHLKHLKPSMTTLFTSTHAPGVLWAAVWAVLCSMVGAVWGQFGPQCEEIKIPMCQKMPYNLTRLPNLLHHSTQENAQLAMDQFEVAFGMDEMFRPAGVLCSMYAPICTVGFVHEAIPPCRSVCEAAKQGCEPLLAKFDIAWPANLQCDHLPVYDRSVCITPQAIISSGEADTQLVCYGEADIQPVLAVGPTSVLTWEADNQCYCGRLTSSAREYTSTSAIVGG
ncbi:Secreted frizzled-related protein 4-like [Homarus americanus]|uniref:Secreted frizzled-related protein 4-like n=1 Tax=Homarus americanus TaxID=6706 RepID=A0A8J5N3Z6_HOMAM|nr:Secreted frizzled-related protein 4-like [Homarus americanus]